jgi:hypothetical protein
MGQKKKVCESVILTYAVGWDGMEVDQQTREKHTEPMG